MLYAHGQCIYRNKQTSQSEQSIVAKLFLHTPLYSNVFHPIGMKAHTWEENNVFGAFDNTSLTKSFHLGMWSGMKYIAAFPQVTKHSPGVFHK